MKTSNVIKCTITTLALLIACAGCSKNVDTDTTKKPNATMADEKTTKDPMAEDKSEESKTTLVEQSTQNGTNEAKTTEAPTTQEPTTENPFEGLTHKEIIEQYGKTTIETEFLSIKLPEGVVALQKNKGFNLGPGESVAEGEYYHALYYNGMWVGQFSVEHVRPKADGMPFKADLPAEEILVRAFGANEYVMIQSGQVIEKGNNILKYEPPTSDQPMGFLSASNVYTKHFGFGMSEFFENASDLSEDDIYYARGVQKHLAMWYTEDGERCVQIAIDAELIPEVSIENFTKDMVKEEALSQDSWEFYIKDAQFIPSGDDVTVLERFEFLDTPIHIEMEKDENGYRTYFVQYENDEYTYLYKGGYLIGKEKR